MAERRLQGTQRPHWPDVQRCLPSRAKPVSRGAGGCLCPQEVSQARLVKQQPQGSRAGPRPPGPEVRSSEDLGEGLSIPPGQRLPLSWGSCPHGMGRALHSRGEAEWVQDLSAAQNAPGAVSGKLGGTGVATTFCAHGVALCV